MQMHFYPTERMALFIDGANLYATAKALGFDIDYKRLAGAVPHEGPVGARVYYTALAEDQEYSSIRPLVDWLDYNGYTMVTKPTKEFTDASGRRKIKGNMDIELDRRRHASRRASRPCRAVLRRRRFPRPGRRPAAHGQRVSVVSTLQTQPPMVADELRRQADQFIDLSDMEELVCRTSSDHHSRGEGGGGRGQSAAQFSNADSDDFADA